MKLAAHLCSKYITQLLSGDTTFVKFLRDTHGFRRFQLNATAANNVDSRFPLHNLEGGSLPPRPLSCAMLHEMHSLTRALALTLFRCSSLGPAEAAAFRKAAEELPDIEFIVQRNEETRALWEVCCTRAHPSTS